MSKKTKRKSRKLRTYLLVVVTVLLLGVLTFVYLASQPTSNQAESAASQTKKKGYDAYAGINSDDIENLGLLWEVGFDQEQIPIAALVHVDSIDGGRNYSPIFERYIVSETYGKMTILEVYKGDVQTGQELQYSRTGGIITRQEYLNALNAPGSEETYLHGRRPAEKKYIKEYIVDDIDVEVGKNYLAFMIPESSKDGKYHEYRITGVNFGFREVRGSGGEATIFNRVTGKWESLSSVVKLTK